MKFSYIVEASGGAYDGCYSFVVASHDSEESAQAWVDEYNKKVKELKAHCNRLHERAWNFAVSLEDRYDTYCKNVIAMEKYWKLFVKTVPPQQSNLQEILEDYYDVQQFHRFKVKKVVRKK